jgi:hypothetical protein
LVQIIANRKTHGVHQEADFKLQDAQLGIKQA